MSDIAALEKRIKALEDIREIHELKARYLRACDLQRPEDVRACFVANALIDYESFPPFHSRDAFVDIYAKLGCQPEIVDMHHGHNPTITLIDDNRASGQWDLFWSGLNLKLRTNVQLSGQYQDEYVRESGRWLIKSTVFRRGSFTLHTVGPDGLVKCSAFGKDEAPRMA